MYFIQEVMQILAGDHVIVGCSMQIPYTVGVIQSSPAVHPTVAPRAQSENNGLHQLQTVINNIILNNFSHKNNVLLRKTISLLFSHANSKLF